MVVFAKRSKAPTLPPPVQTPTPSMQDHRLYSDVVAGRKGTHPDARFIRLAGDASQAVPAHTRTNIDTSTGVSTQPRTNSSVSMGLVQSTHQNTGQNTEQNTEQSTRPSTDQNTYQNTDQNTDQNIDQSTHPSLTPGQALITTFNTFELCEQILSYLDFNDLNRARDVCRQFKSVAEEGSLLLQRRLFLEPCASKTLRELQPWWCDQQDMETWPNQWWQPEVDDALANALKLHPMLRYDIRSDKLFGPAYLFHGSTSPCCLHHVHGSATESFNFHAVPSSSLSSRMYLTQPPVKEVTVWRISPIECGADDKCATLHDPNGVNFGQVYASFESLTEGRPFDYAGYVHFEELWARTSRELGQLLRRRCGCPWSLVRGVYE